LSRKTLELCDAGKPERGPFAKQKKKQGVSKRRVLWQNLINENQILEESHFHPATELVDGNFPVTIKDFHSNRKFKRLSFFAKGLRTNRKRCLGWETLPPKRKKL
jgi:hypothetical protein